MKKVLVIGAAGCIGVNTIKYLLSEGKYEITALDLNNKKSKKRLHRYRKRINIVYGDVNDSILIDGLIKGHDVVINLASVMPPLSDYNSALAHIIDYKGTENIIRAINYFNPKCFLVYTSTTSLYGKNEPVSVKTKINKDELSSYCLSKIETEELIKKNLDNYVILRLSLVLNNIKKDPFMFNIRKNDIVECITNFDASYACVKVIDHIKKVNKKVFNVGGGRVMQQEYNVILKNILKYHGLSIKYFLYRIFLDKNYYSPILTDSDELNDIINFRSDSMQSYYMRLKRHSKNRRVQKLLAHPLVVLKSKR